MKPRIEAGVQTGILLEDRGEVEVLRSYFTGDQPESFSQEALAARLVELTRRFDEAKRGTGTFPVEVNLDDVRDLGLPAVELGISEVYATGSGFAHLAASTLTDYSHTLRRNLANVASTSVDA